MINGVSTKNAMVNFHADTNATTKHAILLQIRFTKSENRNPMPNFIVSMLLEWIFKLETVNHFYQIVLFNLSSTLP